MFLGIHGYATFLLLLTSCLIVQFITSFTESYCYIDKRLSIKDKVAFDYGSQKPWFGFSKQHNLFCKGC